MPNPRDIDDLLSTIKRVKPAFFNGVPTLYTAILNHPDVRGGQRRPQSIKLCFSGAARAHGGDEAAVRGRDRCPHHRGLLADRRDDGVLREPGQGPNKIGSIGMPLPDVDVRIVDAETARGELAPGEVGEMIMRAPQYMAEYWNNPLETAEALRDRTLTASGGCTPAIWPTWTRTATSSSSTGRKT